MTKLIVPVVFYVFVTLGCPLLDGQRGERYAEHAAIVLGLTLVCTLAFMFRRQSTRVVKT